MSANSPIEWTEATWNPTTGCDAVSPGCDNCYAERMSFRLQAMGSAKYKNGFNLTLHPDTLELPLHWKKPQRIFVNSMSDLFHDEVPFQYIESVFETMRLAHWHQFQVLTKRSGRLLALTERLQWPSNVWMGVSVESPAYKSRIDHLRKTGAVVKFLSLEPLLEDLGTLDLRGISWVIVGGESGPGARPMHRDWVRSLRDQCQAAGVAFFFKQWGEWAPATREHGTVGSMMPETGEKYTWIGGDGRTKNPSSNGLIDPVMAVARVGKKAAGRLLDGREWNEMPEGVKYAV